MTPSQLRAAYDFLKMTAFHDVPLPKRVRILRKPLRKAWGYYYTEGVIEVCSSIRDWHKMLRVLAHEMAHASLDMSECDCAEHGPAFKALSEVICQRMGWPLRGF